MERLQSTSVQLEHALLSLDQEAAIQIVREAQGNNSPDIIAGELISSTLMRIGDSWELGNLSLSQVYMSGIICEKVIDKILPPQSPIRKSQPKMAIAVLEDFHLLGKRIIYSTLRASGFELVDLGGGLSIERLIDIVKAEDIKILLLSVLMLSSALRVKELKTQLHNSDVTIVVGGAPFRFDEQLWKEVNADYYGKDSSEALQIVQKIMGDRL
ncbi:MAG: cobalamin-dependent protein [Bacteroidales bacterium]|nr:cobalamin-dependent protein [Bacteroidales bacterium]